MEASLTDVNYPQFLEGEDPPCAETDPEMFFSEDVSESYNPLTGRYTTHTSYYNAKAARAVCSSCPLMTQCLNYALSDRTIQGIWGGTTEYDRKLMRKKMNLGKE
jgi:WhiB family redox-sensing transcriptional regulator